MSNQLGFAIDTSTCVGCKTCEIACKDEHDLSVGPRPRFVREFHGGEWIEDEKTPNGFKPQDVFSYSVSVACNHCNNPVCVTVCSQAALIKREEDGVVVVTDDCIGCGTCAEACPYNAPQIDEETNKNIKCDFCIDLLEVGMAPACVETCPMRALHYGDIEELQNEYGDLKDIAPLPSSEETDPNLVIIPHKDAKTSLEEGAVVSLYRQE